MADTGDLGHLVVVGPTASGKSDLAMAWARAEGGEIAAIDAMQVYRGMDVGTATPPPTDRAEVRHHLLDLVDPGDEFTVAQFVGAFRRVEQDVASRGQRLVVVGGTGLYVRACLDRLDLPGQWPEVRAELEAAAARDGAEVLHQRLAQVDPVAAARIEPGNARRTVRALEVTLGSGRPFSSYGPGLDHYPPTPHRQVGLRWSREVLATRIEERVHRMLDAGWLAEVERLLAVGPLSRTAASALGYRQLADHLEGRCTLEAAVAETVQRTRTYAVRQERWFRRDPRIRWAVIEHDVVAEALPVARQVWST